MVWDSESMNAWLVKYKATREDLNAYRRLLNWTERKPELRGEFQEAETPSFVVKFEKSRLPRAPLPLQILTVRGTAAGPYAILYSRHFIGQQQYYNEWESELESAICLQAEMWRRFIEEFRWPSLIAALKRFKMFQANCRKLGPKETLLKSVELGTAAPEPKVLLRNVSDPDKFSTLLDEFVARRLEIPSA